MPSDEHSASVLRHFFHQWSVSAEALRLSFYDTMAEDCAFTNPGFPTVYGPKETEDKMIVLCREVIQQETITVEILNLAVVDGVAFHERIDHIVRTDGSIAISIPVTGVMMLTEDSKIQTWSEYFDSAPVMAFIEQCAASADAGGADADAAQLAAPVS